MSNCHICNSPLPSPILDFGAMPLANTLLSNPNEEYTQYHAAWSWCDECELLQLIDVPDADVVFTSEYPYRTDQSRFMTEHFKKTAGYLMERVAPENVLEIGVNTGGILEWIPNDIGRFGYETSLDCTQILAEKGIACMTLPFKRGTTLPYQHGLYDLVYSANTLRSLKNIGEIFETVKTVLSKRGVFVIEEPALPFILERNEWDQFYSENVFAFSITSMSKLAHRCGLELVDVDLLPENHGGSMRWHIAHPNTYVPEPDVELIAERLEESEMPIELKKFNHAIRKTRDDFVRALQEEKDSGREVIAYGASAKSVTALNYCGINAGLIAKVFDSTPSKIGKYLPGTGIQIVDAGLFRNEPKDKLVTLLPYNVAREIIEKEDPNRERRWLLYHPGVHYFQ